MVKKKTGLKKNYRSRARKISLGNSHCYQEREEKNTPSSIRSSDLNQERRELLPKRGGPVGLKKRGEQVLGQKCLQ